MALKILISLEILKLALSLPVVQLSFNSEVNINEVNKNSSIDNKDASHCDPGAVEMKIHKLEADHQSMQEKLDYIIKNLDNKCSPPNTLDVNNTEAVSTSKATSNPLALSTSTEPKTSSISFLRNCSVADGFVLYKESNQYFRLFVDERLKWDDAKSKCETEGLQMAEPADDIAVQLRKDLLDNCGNGFAWVGARGGSSYRWQSDGRVLPNDSPLWWTRDPGSHELNNRFCLLFLVQDRLWKRQPTHPYGADICNNQYFPLCERVLG